MADDKDIKIKIILNDGGTSATLKNINDQIISSKVPIQDLRKELGNFVVTSKKIQSSVNVNRKQFSALGKSVGGFTSQTGAATSATLEFGRVLSDAPYGIRGVANNLQQLASNLFFMSKGVDSATGKTIGFGGAIGGLFKSLAGPAGILIAFQGIIALLDYFKVGMGKAESSASDFESSLTSLRRTLDDLGVSQEDMNQKIEDYIILQDLKKKLDKSQEDSTERLLEIEEDLISLREDNAKKQKELLLDMTVAEYEALSNEEKAAHRRETLSVDFDKRFKQLKKNIKEEVSLEKEKRDVTKGSLEIQKEYNKSKKLFNAADEDSLQGLKNSKKEKEKERELLSKTSQEYKKLTITIDEYQKKIEAIEGKKGKKGKKGSKLDLFDTPEELELKVKSTLDARQKLAQQTELIQLKTEESARLSMTKSEEDKTFIKEDYARRRLDITEEYEKKAMKAKVDAEIKSASESHIAYVKKIDKDLAAFEAKLGKEGKALTSAEKTMLTNAKKAASDKKESAGTELMATVTQIQDEYTKLFPFWEIMAKARRAAIGEGKPIENTEEYTLEDGLKQYMELQSSMTSFLGGEYDRQLTIEQNKTNALNNELNERLLNENLSKDERERIQLQIGQNDEKLRKKQEQIEKKRFKLNKAANIANATINTYLGATQVLASETIPDVAKPFVMAATIASGLLQVAQIARQKFQSSAGSGGSIGPAGGGAGGEGESREFNFNLAGSTQSNQLTQSIAGQLNQPIQTYVVSSEITSQQQLDLSISNTASLG